MTYLQYHYIFTFPLLLILAFITWLELRRGRAVVGDYRSQNRWAWGFFWLMPIIATLYTTPWDNYLIYKGVWNYPPERVLFTIGYVPFEEHLFFVLQCLIVGLWLFLLLRRIPSSEKSLNNPLEGSSRAGNPLHRWIGLGFFGLLSMIGAALLFVPHGFYMGLILAWACPIIAFQWVFGGDLILSNRKAFWWGLLPPTVYLWITDTLAIGTWGIWDISRELSFNIRPFGLPLEEAVFFLITNLLVVQGLLLFLHPLAVKRAQKLALAFKPWVGCIALFALLKIPVPLWNEGFPLLGTLSTCFLALGALLWAWQKIGPRALLLALFTFGLGLAVELLGSRTGFPFGAYSYTAPQPTLWGVPLLVPLGWWAMTLSAHVMAKGKPFWTGALLVVWDIALEPMMTAQQHYWVWNGSSLYYNVPLQNFVAWFGVGVLISWLFGKFAPKLNTKDSGGDFGWAYRLEALFLPMGLLLYGHYAAALISLVLMGGLALWHSQNLLERLRKGASKLRLEQDV